MPYSKLHQAARDYAEAGFGIFPVSGKTPPLIDEWQHRATTDLDMIDQWWTTWPDANIGFVPETAGMCVVDLDGDTGLANWEPNKFFSPIHVKTPHGYHVYFAGSLRPTVGRIAPKIDTRGIASYVILPPSVVAGERYEWLTPKPEGDWDLAEVPVQFVELCNREAPTRDRLQPIGTDATDRPEAIKRFQAYLEKNPIPGEGNGSDDAVYRAICRGRDLGLSDGVIVGVLAEQTAFEDDWLWEKVDNVETYAQNEPGCDTPLTATEAHAGLIAIAGQALPSERSPERIAALEADGWVPHDPRDPASMPALEFFDADHLIPKSPDGAIGIIYGKRGDHKTNTVLSLLQSCTAGSMLYAAGEGAYGVERDRIAARPRLGGRIKLLPRVPLLGSQEQVVAFIQGSNSIGYAPDIVVIDTMATALAGEDENSSITAGMLTDNGTVGLIKRTWNCTVILIAHAGKDATRGVRGTSGFEGNVDFLIEVEADKKHGAITTTLKKMRDGYDGFAVHWKYDTSPATVPVPVRIDEAEWASLTAEAPRDETTPVGLVVRSFLHTHGHHNWLTGVEPKELALFLTEQEHGSRPVDIDEAAFWDTSRGKWLKALHNNKNKSWAKECHDEQVPVGGGDMTLRWFCPPPQGQSVPDEA